MKGNLLRIIAVCAVLGATVAFAQEHTRVIHHRGGTQTITYYNQSNHRNGSWFNAVNQRRRTGSSHRTASDYQRDQSYMEGLRRHHDWARLEQFQEREGYDRDDSNRGLHKGWTKGRHNKHRDEGPGH
jgi:hypothetical protein